MSINKKIISILVVFVLIAAGVFAFLFLNKNIPGKNAAPKMYKVGILNGFDYVRGNADGFIAGMAKLGYVEGKNITYDVQSTDVDLEKYRVALKKFADEKVDLIYAFPTEASLEAKKVSQESGIPFVFAHANFEDMNLIDSIERPGNNLTGVRYPGPTVALKRLEVMLEIFPDIKKIAVPYSKGYPNVPPQINILKEYAPKLGVEIIEVPVTTPEELENALNSLLGKIDAIMTLAEPVSGVAVFANVYSGFAYKNNIPVGGTLLLKDKGYEYETIFGADANAFTSGEKASVMADKVFKGINPGTIPVESAEIYLEFNYRHAQELGVTIDEGLLSTADNIVR